MDNQVIKVDLEQGKKKLIALRACDIHAIERIDNKFIKDDYYSKIRENVRFMEIGRAHV